VPCDTFTGGTGCLRQCGSLRRQVRYTPATRRQTRASDLENLSTTSQPATPARATGESRDTLGEYPRTLAVRYGPRAPLPDLTGPQGSPRPLGLRDGRDGHAGRCGERWPDFRGGARLGLACGRDGGLTGSSDGRGLRSARCGLRGHPGHDALVRLRIVDVRGVAVVIVGRDILADPAPNALGVDGMTQDFRDVPRGLAGVVRDSCHVCSPCLVPWRLASGTSPLYSPDRACQALSRLTQQARHGLDGPNV